jgi:hypothetical protein
LARADPQLRPIEGAAAGCRSLNQNTGELPLRCSTRDDGGDARSEHPQQDCADENDRGADSQNVQLHGSAHVAGLLKVDQSKSYQTRTSPQSAIHAATPNRAWCHVTGTTHSKTKRNYQHGRDKRE